jgi:hypothetical protein
MRLDRLVLTALLITVLGGCRATPTPEPDWIETIIVPFYGELVFEIVRADTSAPIPGVTLETSGLYIAEERGGASIQSDQEGRIVIHQLARRDSYRGESPSQTFTFSAPQYRTRTYSAEDLAAGTSYDPYHNPGLPTTTFEDSGEEIELSVFQFTIRLEPSD